jgi:hypothetical protein
MCIEITIRIDQCRDCPYACLDYENEAMLYRNHCEIDKSVIIGDGKHIPSNCPKR